MVAPRHWRFVVPVFLGAVALAFAAHAQFRPDNAWAREFPKTDFTKTAIHFNEIVTDGPKRDQIPPIHKPKFIKAADDREVGREEPVLTLGINGDARAYPIRMLLWHEIVNDEVGGVPVLVSYCPLCNSGVVYDRRLDGELISFGNTGRIRHADMVMYDHQTESWWQQFTGEAIIGKLTGKRMKLIPARLESLGRFIQRWPEGKLLIPNDRGARRYGQTPYGGMDTGPASRMFSRYPVPQGVRHLERVIVVGDEAWTLKLLRKSRKITKGDLVLTWAPGQNSIHDNPVIARGRDVGNVVVQKKQCDKLVDFPYDVTFAFAFSAFRPKGTLHTD